MIMIEQTAMSEKYTPRSITLSELDIAINKIWNELQQHGSIIRKEAEEALREEAISAGVSLDQLFSKPREEAIKTEQDGEGIDPISTAIIVSFIIPVAGHITKSLWDKVILPWILNDKGSRALVKKD